MLVFCLLVVIESGLDSTVNVLPCLEVTRCLATNKSFIYFWLKVKFVRKVMQIKGVCLSIEIVGADCSRFWPFLERLRFFAVKMTVTVPFSINGFADFFTKYDLRR